MSRLTETQTPLARLNEILAMLDYPSHHMPVSKENPFEQVLVVMDQDLAEEDDPRYILQLFFAEDVMRSSGLTDEGLDNSATLQFMLEAPISFENLPIERQLQGFKALNLFTQIMPIGNFGLNSDNKVYFRYGMMDESQNMNATLVAELVGMFAFFIGQLGPLLADFVISDKSIETLMEETGFHKAFEGAQG